jgi:hypothetical protein
MIGIIMGLSGCGGIHLIDYKENKPNFELEHYFNGPIKAWGIVQNFRGKVTRSFHITMQGTWNDNVGTLVEHFVYDDGETQERTWTITKNSDGSYSGKADDILDEAFAQSSGNATQWSYRMDLKVGDSTYRVTFDDWMFRMDDKVIVNRSYIKKFGLTVAELTIFMQKQ